MLIPSLRIGGSYIHSKTGPYRSRKISMAIEKYSCANHSPLPLSHLTKIIYKIYILQWTPMY